LGHLFDLQSIKTKQKNLPRERRKKMKIFRAVFMVVCLVAVATVSFAQEVKVLKAKPFVYEKTVMVEDDTKVGTRLAVGTGGGMAAGTATGCVVGGPIGCVIGFLGGMYAGASAGAVGAAVADKVPQQVRVNGYMVTFDNGQTVLTQQKYNKGQKLHTEKLVYDKVI
jgi:outer membrane lipoprotein SlyB